MPPGRDVRDHVSDQPSTKAACFIPSLASMLSVRVLLADMADMVGMVFSAWVVLSGGPKMWPHGNQKPQNRSGVGR